MEKAGPEPPPKPCDYFDIFRGTSASGLVNGIINVTEFRANK